MCLIWICFLVLFLLHQYDLHCIIQAGILLELNFCVLSLGWLLQLGETELHGLAEATSGYTSQPKKHLRVKEPETNRLKHSLDLGDTFREAERLFFMDTTGENGDNADEGNLNSASDTRTSERKSSRKRKERQILFRRHGQLMNKEEDEKDDIVNTNSSSDEMVSDAEVFEVKRPKEDIALAC